MSFYWKVWVYTLFLVFLFFSFYYPYIVWEKTTQDTTEIKISHVGTWYFIGHDFTENTFNSSFIAEAYTVGKIIESNWDFKILKDGQEIQSDEIDNWDLIVLMNNSELKFSVNSGTNAFIKWPAKFDITYLWLENWTPKYVINLNYGSYFEIVSDSVNTDNLVIKTEKIEIESKNLWDRLDLNIKTQWERQIIENRWWEIVMKKVVNNQKKYASLKTNQTAQIDDDIKLLQEVKTIAMQVKKSDIEESYSITWDVYSGFEGIETLVPLMSGDLETKLILSDEKMAELKRLLTPSFLQNDIEWISITYLNWNEDWYDISYDKLITRIDKIYSIIGWDAWKSSSHDMQYLYIVLDQMINEINNNYYIPDDYLNRMRTVLEWISLLKEKDFWKFKTKAIEFDKIFDKLWLQNEHNSLIFK